MSATVRDRPARAVARNGGVPARRAVIRWAWRLLRREWRQQLLILALITVAVGATLVGSAVATNTPAPAGAGFGTATDMASFPSLNSRVTNEIAALARRFGRVDVIENETFSVPGSVATYSLRAQNPHRAFGQPMLSLVSGHYPTGIGQVALTSGVASALHLTVGDTWSAGGSARRVVGIVTNPKNLVDEFALVAPGQVGAPTLVTVLFDAPGVNPPTTTRAISNIPSMVAVSEMVTGLISLVLTADARDTTFGPSERGFMPGASNRTVTREGATTWPGATSANSSTRFFGLVTMPTTRLAEPPARQMSPTRRCSSDATPLVRATWPIPVG